jgi:AraC family transcriptional regulator of adaptative response/methylated-DNA-[protein]-cysteine methyltransferase
MLGQAQKLHSKERSSGAFQKVVGQGKLKQIPGAALMSIAMIEASRPGPATSTRADDARWDAVRRRDPAYDGKFFFAVKTTGVYCRPSCASRAAKRENVSFYPTAEGAERAGYRACKRCRPDRLGAADPKVEAVRRACERIAAAEEAPSLKDLAARAGLSPFHFHRLFKKVTGVTPKAYAAQMQARRAAEGLRTAGTVTEAIYDAGFNSSSRFYETSAARLGMTPTALRRGGAGAVIRFAVGETSLGAVLVAATDKGVCAIMLGDDPDRLARALQDRFPRAELVGGDAGFERMVAEAVGLVEAPGRGLNLPLDIRGTAFQERVWQALRAIPPGKTATYAEIARAVGRPKAARAVAQACAANPLAIAIPCHRVVRTDGDLSGYRWGVERKRELIAREAA